MILTEHYDDMEQRNLICKDYESHDYRMLEDNFDPDWEKGDEPHGMLTFTDEPSPVSITEPPKSTHISVLVSIEVGDKRPAKVKRVWEGRDYFYDCFVTENIKDQYVNGDIQVGDHLLVLFEEGEQIVTSKVFKSG